MDRFRTIQVFVEVAKQGNFSAAAETLGMSKSVVSRAIGDLEAWLGVPLFTRSTRQVRLTPTGTDYLEKCLRITRDIDQLRRGVPPREREPEGELRITAPVFFGKHFLGPVLPGFLESHPKLTVTVQLLDRFVNLVEEGFDVALRVSRSNRQQDQGLAMVKLVDMELKIFAAPAYLEKHGTPRTPADLKEHNCLVDLVAAYKDRWPMDKKGRVRHKVRGNFSVNSGELILDLALKGIGIGILPDFFIAEPMRDGRLVPLLEDEATSGERIYSGAVSLVYPKKPEVSPELTAFTGYLRDHFHRA